MKKEKILVVVFICIMIAGAVFYKNLKFDSNENGGRKENVDNIDQKTNLIATNSSNIDWQPYIKGLDIAKAEDKPVFLYFHADWCTYCTKLKKTTFADKNVLNYLNDNFISITIDTDREKKLANQWEIKGLPTLWFLKADNSKISSIPGYIGPDYFLNVLRYVRTKSYDKMTFQDFVKTI
jgi:thioredoxin-related protein